MVRVSGEDATRFLQGLLTADVGELTPGQATPAALLTVKGKIVSELWVLAVDEDEPWLAIPQETAEAVVTSLDDHVIMDDVELEVLEDQRCALIWGEGGEALRFEPEDPALKAFACTHPLPGTLVVGPRAVLAARLEGRGENADAQAFDRARIAHARPAWGYELVADRFPPEVGFVDAVSYEKGCYMGQEPLSRIHNRGQVNRVMVRLAGEGEGWEPLPLTLTLDGAEVGQWTSAARASGDGQKLLGLGIIKRAHAKVGVELYAGTQRVEVCSGPLGDDPGIGGRKQSATVSLGGR
nr:hypothetical protein [Pseudenhygromyxa sp. WMMC2535]